MLSKTLTVIVALFACIAFSQDDVLKRERGGADAAEKNAAKDFFEGKAPPQMAMELWMNLPKGKPATNGSASSWQEFAKSCSTNTPATPTWDSLKGKVVVLDFWAYW